MSLLNKRWIITKQDPTKDVVTKLFENRGIFSKEDRDTFILPNPEEYLHDPFLLEDMDKACERITRAINDKERIVVFGDYDADGVTATAVLVRTLKKLGAEVSFRIPHRIKDGYSLKNYFLDELKDLNVKVVITVDNGIAAAREIQHANDLGMDIIVTDHHTAPPKEDMPIAYAIVNPKVEGCEYPYKELSGSAVALKLCDALLALHYPNREERNAFRNTLYQIAAMGIIADCMPLTGENRAIVKIGLESMRTNPLRGLESLMNIASVNQETLTSQDVAFMLAPRINAAGRLEHAYSALQLFLSQGDNVEEVAEKLDKLNAERKTHTKSFTEEAEMLLKDRNASEKLILISSPNWNSGINGLVASRLVEQYALPTIVLAEREDDYVASCRSIDEFNIIESLQAHGTLLAHFGGHPGAAGFSILKENFEEFKSKMHEYALAHLADYTPQGKILVDTDIVFRELTMQTLKSAQVLEPFGLGNPAPKYLLENVVLEKVKAIGKTSDHLSFQVGNIRGIAFGFGKYADQLQNQSVDMIISLEENTWNGETSLQVRGWDFRETILC